MAPQQLSLAVLSRGHAHNDYEHKRPLLEALEYRFGSIEADVFLVDGKLLVGHNRKDLTPERTLEALYLAPLAARIKQNKGFVYAGQRETVMLLVDVKEDGANVYSQLKKEIAAHPEFAKYRLGVKFVISGDRAKDLIKADNGRPAGIDGRFPDLAKNYTEKQMPLISESYLDHFKWYGTGPMPEAQYKELKMWVDMAHAKGKKIRFWASPDKPAVWQVLKDVGVDYINVDDLAGFSTFWWAKNR